MSTLCLALLGLLLLSGAHGLDPTTDDLDLDKELGLDGDDSLDSLGSDLESSPNSADADIDLDNFNIDNDEILKPENILTNLLQEHAAPASASDDIDKMLVDMPSMADTEKKKPASKAERTELAEPAIMGHGGRPAANVGVARPLTEKETAKPNATYIIAPKEEPATIDEFEGSKGDLPANHGRHRHRGAAGMSVEEVTSNRLPQRQLPPMQQMPLMQQMPSVPGNAPDMYAFQTYPSGELPPPSQDNTMGWQLPMTVGQDDLPASKPDGNRLPFIPPPSTLSFATVANNAQSKPSRLPSYPQPPMPAGLPQIPAPQAANQQQLAQSMMRAIPPPPTNFGGERMPAFQQSQHFPAAANTAEDFDGERVSSPQQPMPQVLSPLAMDFDGERVAPLSIAPQKAGHGSMPQLFSPPAVDFDGERASEPAQLTRPVLSFDGERMRPVAQPAVMHGHGGRPLPAFENVPMVAPMTASNRSQVEVLTSTKPITTTTTTPTATTTTTTTTTPTVVRTTTPPLRMPFMAAIPGQESHFWTLNMPQSGTQTASTVESAPNNMDIAQQLLNLMQPDAHQLVYNPSPMQPATQMEAPANSEWNPLVPHSNSTPVEETGLSNMMSQLANTHYATQQQLQLQQLAMQQQQHQVGMEQQQQQIAMQPQQQISMPQEVNSGRLAQQATMNPWMQPMIPNQPAQMMPAQMMSGLGML